MDYIKLGNFRIKRRTASGLLYPFDPLNDDCSFYSLYIDAEDCFGGKYFQYLDCESDFLRTVYHSLISSGTKLESL